MNGKEKNPGVGAQGKKTVQAYNKLFSWYKKDTTLHVIKGFCAGWCR